MKAFLMKESFPVFLHNIPFGSLASRMIVLFILII
jgi:hypothetical protein